MEKKEFPKKEFLRERELPEKIPGPAGRGKGMSHFYSRIFSILKFILGVCLLAFVYSFSAGFLKELQLIDPGLQDDFWAGISSFIVFYLFVYEPAILYRKGQKIVEAVFKFFAPLVKTAPYVLPIYTIIIFCLYGILSSVIKNEEAVHYFIFLFGMSLVFHLVFTAKTMRFKQGDFIKANYIFGMAFIYILNIMMAAFCFSLIFEKFSFINFCNNSYLIARDMFQALFKQIFLPQA